MVWFPSKALHKRFINSSSILSSFKSIHVNLELFRSSLHINSMSQSSKFLSIQMKNKLLFALQELWKHEPDKSMEGAFQSMSWIPDVIFISCCNCSCYWALFITKKAIWPLGNWINGSAIINKRIVYNSNSVVVKSATLFCELISKRVRKNAS